jgi:hypothetical protein
VIRHRHGKKVRVKTRPHQKVRKVTKCHAKTKRVRVVVRVPLHRHGKIVKHHGKVVYRKKIEHKRVVVQPHWKNKTKLHVRHGHTTTVSGWLGLTDGTACQGSRRFPRCDHGNSPPSGRPVMAGRSALMASRWRRMR